MERVESVLKHDSWAAAEGESTEGKFMLRWRTPIVEVAKVGTYTTRLLVSWCYANAGSGLLPDEDQENNLEIFERKLCDLWEHDGTAFLAGVLTLDGLREWVFYTKSVAACAKRIAELPQEKSPYPIELEAEEDKDWTYLYTTLLGGIEWQPLQEEWEKELLAAKGHLVE